MISSRKRDWIPVQGEVGAAGVAVEAVCGDLGDAGNGQRLETDQGPDDADGARQSLVGQAALQLVAIVVFGETGGSGIVSSGSCSRES